MGANVAVFGTLVVLLCVGLFIAGVRLDESAMNGGSGGGGKASIMPMRRSLTALQYENEQLRSRINASLVEMARSV